MVAKAEGEAKRISAEKSNQIAVEKNKYENFLLHHIPRTGSYNKRYLIYLSETIPNSKILLF